MGLNFSGATETLELANISNVGDYSWSIWVAHDLTSNHDAPFQPLGDNFSATPRNAGAFPRSYTGDTIRFEAYVGGTGGVQSPARPGDWGNGNWTHLAATRQGTTVTVYVNGTSGGTITVGSGTFTAENIRIGSEYYSGSNQRFWDGKIADAACWSVLLSAAELAALARGVSPMRVRPGKLYYYHPLFHIADPSPDLSGNGRNGTHAGTPDIAAHAPVEAPFGLDGRFEEEPAAGAAPTVIFPFANTERLPRRRPRVVSYS